MRSISHQPARAARRARPCAVMWFTALAALGGASCQSSPPESTTALRVSAAWNGKIDQLEYSVISAAGAIHAPERRPGVAAEPLASEVDVVIYLPDQLEGQAVRCLVTGYLQGAPVQRAEAEAGVVGGSVVDVRVTLSPTWGVADGGPGTDMAGGADAGPRPKGNGQPCGAAADCNSGFCVDGVCCESACAGACHACNLPAKMGSCSPLAAGARDTLCVQQPMASCGLDGTCNASGACQNYAAGTACMAGTCSGNTVVGGRTCDGRGTCQGAASQSCGSYTCDPATRSCKTRCTSNGDCASPNVCASGVCGTFKPLGDACSAAGQCASGNCVDGVCCQTAACGACYSCNLSGAAGTCRPVPAGNAEPHGLCSVQPVATCGLDGTCNGSGGCASYPNGTVCRMARTCSNGMCR
jgi:hypothetical protein